MAVDGPEADTDPQSHRDQRLHSESVEAQTQTRSYRYRCISGMRVTLCVCVYTSVRVSVSVCVGLVDYYRIFTAAAAAVADTRL